MKKIIVAPSILSADFSNIKSGVTDIENAGGDWVHIDVMDGSFVPPITFGQKMVADIRKLTEKTLDVHLMVNHPETMIKSFAEAGADIITIHQEATVHVHRVISSIKDMNVTAGISIVPSTPVSALKELLPFIDLVLIMSVNPGFGGQKVIKECLTKLSELLKIKKDRGYNYYIEVDGGVNAESFRSFRESGAEVLVTGSAFFDAEDKGKYIELLKGSI